MNMQSVAETFERLEETTRRTEMVRILAELFRAVPASDLARVIYLCQGRLLPPFEPLEFGVGDRTLVRAEALAMGVPEAQIEKEFRELGDLGSVAAKLRDGKRPPLDVVEVYEQLMAVARASGKGSTAKKVELLASLLGRLSGEEAKYVVRIVQGRLRLGAGDPTILDALSVAVSGSTRLRPVLEHAYNVTSDLGLVGEVLFDRGVEALREFQPAPGRPVRPALAERLASPEEIIAKIGPCIAEPKYDGLRLQLHKRNGEIFIFSRRMENLTGMFPDLAQAAREQLPADRVIVEGEAVAHNPETGEFLPFQETVQRKRKHEIEKMSVRYPLRLFLFDLLHVAGRGMLREVLAERRAALERLLRVQQEGPIVLTEYVPAGDAADLELFFQEMIERGLEGVVAKNPRSTYRAGTRSFDWIKLKRGYQTELTDTVDCVLVGYLLGKGNRARFGIGSLLVAIYDRKHDRFRTVAKIGSGLSDEGWQQMKALLDGVKTPKKPARLDSQITPDVWAEPVYVVEVQADEITRSPVHTAGKRDGEPGYALRFPRLVNWIRFDKSPEDATSEEEILDLYRIQRRVEKKT